jgi:uncharacterized protein (TIGR00369 family)
VSAERLDPRAFAEKLNEWGRGTMIGSHGTRFISAGEGKALAELRFKPELFPLTIQLSVNLVGNAGQGTLTAEAEIIHRGRTTLVVQVKVKDDREKLIATLVATQLAPTPR